jgi:hypothetical protein
VDIGSPAIGNPHRHSHVRMGWQLLEQFVPLLFILLELFKFEQLLFLFQLQFFKPCVCL